jgi:hypothetical protein
VLVVECSSEYIHFQDADDRFHPEWWQRVRAEIQDGATDVVFNEIAAFEGDRVRTPEVMGLRRASEYPSFLAFAIEGVLLTCSGTYAKELVIRVGGYREELWQSEDYDFNLRIVAAEPKLHLIPDALIYHRLHAGSRSNDGAACLRDLVRSLELLAPVLPACYHPQICERLAGAGCSLFRLGDLPAGKHAMQLSKRFGKPCFPTERTGFRRLARVLGPAWAVRVCNSYRLVVPKRFRHWAAAQGI